MEKVKKVWVNNKDSFPVIVVVWNKEENMGKIIGEVYSSSEVKFFLHDEVPVERIKVSSVVNVALNEIRDIYEDILYIEVKKM